MEHPLVIDPRDPLVERMRGICLAYPESAEVRAWGRPTFRAGKKIFIMVSASMDRPHTVVFKPDEDERLAYLDDPRFFSPAYWGPGGWLAIDIDSPSTDWTELAELIDTSYRGVALRRQLTALDSRTPNRWYSHTVGFRPSSRMRP
jgi:predicted DNA-binding protein (MmcQ/YjbR family)